MEPSAKKRQLPAGIPATTHPTEVLLIQGLGAGASDSGYVAGLWELLRFYQSIGRHDLGPGVLDAILQSPISAEEQAICYHWLGVYAETRGEFDQALAFYDQGIALHPADRATAYFLRNNSGHCLNVKGLYSKAEAICRDAIAIDPACHNAWKNLGQSLQGRGDSVGAAWAYVEAIKLGPADSKAAMFLQALVAEHPELLAKYAGFVMDEAVC
jgi:tetratricopeptide (TPR) repeat protein